jgi:hypothetical protein
MLRMLYLPMSFCFIYLPDLLLLAFHGTPSVVDNKGTEQYTFSHHFQHLELLIDLHDLLSA